jgi:hypothetical protein
LNSLSSILFTSPIDYQDNRKKAMWRGILYNLGIAASLFIIIALTGVILSALFPSNPLVVDLGFWRGYPWLPSACLSIGLVSLSAVIGHFILQNVQGDGKDLPPLINLILKVLLLVNPKPLPPLAWWILAALSLAVLAGLWRFPRCIGSGDFLITFRVSKGDLPIAVIYPAESIKIEPDVKVKIEAEFEAVSTETGLPVLECKWETAGIVSDGKLLHTVGCIVDYQTGKDDIPDSVLLQWNQRRCDPMGYFSFFVERK